MATKKTGAAEKATEKAPKTSKGGTKVQRWGEADPRRLYIVGLDDGFREGEPGFNAELFEPDRIGKAPEKDFVDNLRENGIDPVNVVLFDHPDLGTVPVICKGRQRTMAARMIQAAGESVSVFYFIQKASDALDVTRENEFRKRRTPLEKANHAARLAKLAYKEAEILSSFSDDGAKSITKMTLINWKRAANCCAAIQARCEGGDFPITVCYEIGKIGYNDKDMTVEQKTEAQLAALTKIEAEGGTLKGTKGRANASAAATGDNQEDDDDSDDDDEPSSGNQPRGKSTRLSVEALGELLSRFEPDEDEGYSDLLKKDGKEFNPHAYIDGDFQRLTYALLAVVIGDDPTGEHLAEFPSVHRWVKRYLRSPKE